MESDFDKEFDYSREAIDLLESLFDQRKEKFIQVYEKALDFVKEDRRIYLNEKRSKLQQGKGIRMNRKQLLEKWGAVHSSVPHKYIFFIAIQPTKKL